MTFRRHHDETRTPFIGEGTAIRTSLRMVWTLGGVIALTAIGWASLHWRLAAVEEARPILEARTTKLEEAFQTNALAMVRIDATLSEIGRRLDGLPGSGPYHRGSATITANDPTARIPVN